MCCVAIKHFYEMNDVYLKWKKLDKFKKGAKPTCTINDNDDDYDNIKDRPYTLQEIKQIYDNTRDPRVKVIVSLMSSSGIRFGAFLYFRICDFIPIDEYQIYKIRVYAGEPEEYYTFCTPECRREIEKYLDFRERNGEKIKGLAPLLRKKFNRYNTISASKPKRLKLDSCYKIMQQALEVDCDVREKRENLLSGDKEEDKQAKRRKVMFTHGFRKFFETTTIKNGLPIIYAKRLMGHSIVVDDSYFRPQIEELLEGNEKMPGYLSVIDDLTINEENKLRRENTKLKKELDFTDREIAMMKHGLRTVATKMGLDLEKLDTKFIEQHSN